MRLAGAIVAAVVVSTALVPAAGAAPTAELHHPPQNLALSGAGLLHVVVEVRDAPAGAVLAVRLNDVSSGRITSHRRQDGALLLHAALQLVPGPNTLDIEVQAEGRRVGAHRRNVFFAFPLSTHRDVPPGFARQAFHGLETRPACEGCHVLVPRAEDEGPASPVQSTCHGCHAGLLRVKEVHGPASQWACTRCHDPRSSPARYATPDPPMPLCFTCHFDQKETFYGSRYQHGPTTTGQCTICHNPHGTDHGFFLKKAAWDVCTNCHHEKADGRHVISWGPKGQTHPTRGRPDPNRPDRELSCASCHNPHAAPGPKLWNFKAVRWLDLCRNCHQRIFGG